MRIAQVVDNLIIGGAQKWIVTFAESIRRQASNLPDDSQLTVIALSVEIAGALVDELEAQGACVRLFPFEKLINPKQFLLLVQYLRQEQFDIVQTHLIRANIIGALTGLLANTPVVATLHSTGESAHRYNPLRTKLETFVLRFLVGRIISVGFTIAEVHSKRLAGKPMDVIPNAVVPLPDIPVMERTATREEIVGDASRPLLISVGRISPPKGFHDLLLAVAALRKKHPDVLLVIVGKGSLRDAIAQQITSLQLGNHVFLLGERSDVPRLLGAADIFVSASHREGLPLAILEAMRAGLPVVATSVGDIPHVVSAERGIIVPPHQPSELARVLGTLLDNPAQWQSYGQEGKAYILENHHPGVWLNKLLTVYREVIEHA